MITTANDINPVFKELRTLIKKEDDFLAAKNLCLKLHKLAHDNCFVIPCQHKEHMIMPTSKDVTIAWNLWHITRIEDMVVSRLIYQKEELFEHWIKDLNAPYRDTGNALSDEEIINLSKQVDYARLLEYRAEVAKQTFNLLTNLEYSDLNRKVRKEDLERLASSGSVSNHPNSIWLLDFWGKKDVFGLILMPVLRHPFVHLFDNLKLYHKIKKMPQHLVNVE